MDKYGWGRSRSMMWSHLAIGIGGVFIGATAGLLLAPKSGGELRRLLWRFVTRDDAPSLEQHDSLDAEHDLGRADNSIKHEGAAAH
jgi:gas vesicle protein